MLWKKNLFAWKIIFVLKHLVSLLTFFLWNKQIEIYASNSNLKVEKSSSLSNRKTQKLSVLVPCAYAGPWAYASGAGAITAPDRTTATRAQKVKNYNDKSMFSYYFTSC